MNTLNHISLLLISLTAQFSFAADSATILKTPKCDAKAVTRNCAFFDENKETAAIQLSDGVFFTNPRYQPSASPTVNPPFGPLPGGYNFGLSYGPGYSNQDSIRRQAALHDFLQPLGLTTESRIAIAPLIGSLLIQPEMPVQIAWPMDQKDAPLKFVKAKEILVALEKKTRRRRG